MLNRTSLDATTNESHLHSSRIYKGEKMKTIVPKSSQAFLRKEFTQTSPKQINSSIDEVLNKPQTQRMQMRNFTRSTVTNEMGAMRRHNFSDLRESTAMSKMTSGTRDFQGNRIVDVLGLR